MMNKSELIEALSKDLSVASVIGASIINTILDSMTEALIKGDNIEIRGFGSFTVKKYKSFVGRNPKTGEKTKVPSKRLPFFKVGKELKKAINDGSENKMGPTC
jgi:integration host factor subunit beta